VNQIAPGDVLRFRDSEVADEKSAGTANDRLKIARMAFTTARKQVISPTILLMQWKCCRIPNPQGNRLILTK